MGNPEIIFGSHRQKHGVRFDQPFVDEKGYTTIWGEYMTSKEFWKEADKSIIKVWAKFHFEVLEKYFFNLK